MSGLSKIEVKSGGVFEIEGKIVARKSTKSGGLIYESAKDLWVGKGTSAFSLRTTKGETGEVQLKYKVFYPMVGLKMLNIIWAMLGNQAGKHIMLKWK